MRAAHSAEPMASPARTPTRTRSPGATGWVTSSMLLSPAARASTTSRKLRAEAGMDHSAHPRTDSMGPGGWLTAGSWLIISCSLSSQPGLIAGQRGQRGNT
jgi:hypothetical protein